jgi:hypothetical protein
VTTIANIRTPAEDFLLADAFEAAPTATFEVPPVVAHGVDDPFPYMVTSGAEDGDLPSVLSEDPTVESAECVAPVGEGGLFRITWRDEVRLLLSALVRGEATVLSVRGTDGEWRLRLLVDDRDSLSTTFDFLEDHGVDLRLDGIRDLDADDTYRPFGLSEQQYDALVTGLDEGFYHIPRQTDTCDLSDELGITHQALSERLRRAHGTLVENALASGARVFN